MVTVNNQNISLKPRTLSDLTFARKNLCDLRHSTPYIFYSFYPNNYHIIKIANSFILENNHDDSIGSIYWFISHKMQYNARLYHIYIGQLL